jgi:hypothetical protein
MGMALLHRFFDCVVPTQAQGALGSSARLRPGAGTARGRTG